MLENFTKDKIYIKIKKRLVFVGFGMKEMFDYD